MPEVLRVLLVDDEPLVRRGLRTILGGEPDLEVVGEAADGAEALSGARTLRPDVVCMDVRMPGLDGIRATELLVASSTAPRVLVVTTFASDDYVFAALRAGASGFVLKRAGADELVAAVRAVARGDSLLYPSAVRDMALRYGTPERYTGEPLTARDYRPAVLREAMGHSDYPLQALLYTVVLHRFLRWRLPGYDPGQHLGGVLYLYLRGMCGPETPRVDGEPCGVFSWRPPVALVEELSDLLDGLAPIVGRVR